MIPTQDTNHVTEGVNLLTSRYKGLPAITGLVKACMQRFQQIENSLFDLINAMQLSNHPMVGGPWSVLDQLGSIVGAPRDGLDDADYLPKIRLQIQVNNARGTPEDLLAIGRVMSVPGNQPGYLEMPLAGFYLWVVPLTNPSFALFTPLLSQVRSAASYGLLLYSPISHTAAWGSRYGGGSTEAIGTRYILGSGAKWAAAANF